MVNTYCNFHPQRHAESICEECGRAICLECTRSLSLTQMGDHDLQPVEKVLCPLCFIQLSDQARDRSVVILPICFIISLIGTLVVLITPSWRGYFWGVPGVAVVIIAIPIAFLTLIVYQIHHNGLAGWRSLIFKAFGRNLQEVAPAIPPSLDHLEEPPTFQSHLATEDETREQSLDTIPDPGENGIEEPPQN